MKMRSTMAGLAAAVSMSVAQGDIRITEFMYSGNSGEFVELTNVGATAIDMTGWSYDDDSRTPGVFDLSGFGIVQPNESVIFTEAFAIIFTADWNLPASVKVLGEVTNKLGRNDEINIYDASSNLVDRLTYGDESFAGTLRTQALTGNIPFAALGTNDLSALIGSVVGDSFGSYISLEGDVGNPGVYVPEPAAAALLGLGAVAMLRRRG